MALGETQNGTVPHKGSVPQSAAVVAAAAQHQQLITAEKNGHSTTAPMNGGNNAAQSTAATEKITKFAKQVRKLFNYILRTFMAILIVPST